MHLKKGENAYETGKERIRPHGKHPASAESRRIVPDEIAERRGEVEVGGEIDMKIHFSKQEHELICDVLGIGVVFVSETAAIIAGIIIGYIIVFMI
jgi:hypothetical protein